jgi:multiple sugar transport system substrate-binding protein
MEEIMKKTMIFLMVLTLIAPFALMASGSQESGDTTIELNFIEMLTSPTRTAFLNTVIAEYEAANPGITINLISPPYEQSENKMTMMLNAKQPLDIIESRDATIKQFVNNKQVASMEPFIENWAAKDDFMPISWKAARTIDDTAYILPQLFFVKGMFVRTDILKEHNLEIPKTVEELYQASLAVTDPDNNKFGYVIRGKHNAWKVSQDALSLANVGNVDPENFYKTTDGQFIYDTEEAKAGLQRYVDMYQNAVPSDGINWGFAEQINAFVSGVGAFLIQDPDAIAMIDEQLGRDKYTVVPVPVGEKTGKAYQDFAFNGLSIVSYSEHKQEAWDFITDLISPETNAEFCKTYGALPVYNSSFHDDPFFSTGVFDAWNTMFNNPEVYNLISYPIESDKFAAWGPFQEQYMQRLMLGEATVDETVAVWSEYWTK